MTDNDYKNAVEIGYVRAEFHGDPMVGEDRDDFIDKVHPLALSDALDAFPQYEAPELSDAVYRGINDYFDSFLRSYS